jgi:hypothetical protein
MAISNCLFSPPSENPQGFSVRCVLTKIHATNHTQDHWQQAKNQNI